MRSARSGSRAAASRPSARPLIRQWLGLFLLLLTITFGLSLAHPMTGGPDENAHQRYAYAVVTGQLPIGSDQMIEAPRWISQEGKECWQFHPEIAVTCSSTTDPMDPTATEIVPTGTPAANYPPLYYVLVGPPLLIMSGHHAIFAMRLLSASVFSALCAAGVVAFSASRTLSRRSRAVRSALALACITPTAFALGATINPQSLEIGAAVMLAGAAWPLITTAQGSLPRWITVTLAAALLILSRPTGAVWAVILSVLLAICLWGRIREVLRQRGFQLFAGVSVLACLAEVLWSRFAPAVANYSGVGSTDCGLGCVAEHIRSTWLQNTVHTIGITGWVDAPIPMPYAELMVGIFAILLVAAILAARAPVRIALVLGVLLMPGSAILLEWATIAEAGFMWQARYALPLFIPLLWLAVDVVTRAGSRTLGTEGGIRSRPAPISRFQILPTILVILAAASSLIAFTIAFTRRFWLGAAPGSVLTDAPPVIVAGMLLAIVVTALTAILGVRSLLVRDTSRTAHTDE